MASNLTLQRRPQRAAEESVAFGPIAERFRRAGDLDRAVTLCREGLQKFPNSLSARVTLGWALLDQGKYDEARVELEQVLRRAPDNLAAIRGLAELHDRAEHTMNLPMDGPGQWPPTEESLQDSAPAEFDPEIIREPSLDSLKTAVQFAEADEAAPQFDVQIRPEAPAVFTSSSGAALDVKTEPVAEAASHAEPIAEAVTSETSPATYETHEAAPDDEPIAAEPIHAEAEVHVQAEQQMEQPAADPVSEADIAALLAEAERLEAAATETDDAEIQAIVHEHADSSDSLEVAGEIELEATDDVVLAADAEPAVEMAAEAMAEAVAEPIAEAAAEPMAEAATQPVAEAVAEPVVDAIAEPAAEEFVEAVANVPEETVAEPVAEAADVTEIAAEAIEAVAEPMAEAVAEPITDAIAEPIAEEAVELIEASAAVAAEPVADDVAEPVVEAVAAQVPSERVAEVVEEPMRATPEPVARAAAQTVVEFDSRSRTRFDDTPGEFGLSEAIVAAAIQSSVAHMHLAEIGPMARAARSDPNASTLVKLERFLAQVQARRRELMRQSVA